MVAQPANLRQNSYYSWGSEWEDPFKFSIARVGSDPALCFCLSYCCLSVDDRDLGLLRFLMNIHGS